MKKILLILVCLNFSNITHSAWAQQTTSPIGTKSTETKANSNIFDNAVYVKIGLSAPLGNFGRNPVVYRTIKDSFNGKDGTGAKTGFNFEVGLISYLPDLPLPEKYRLGIDAGIAFSFNEIDWQRLGGGYGNAEYEPFIFAGFKIGPALSYNITDKIILDGFFKLNPGVTQPGQIAYVQQSGNRLDFLAVVADRTFALRKSVGFNVRYASLLLGAEFNFGKVKFKYLETAYIANPNAVPANPQVNIYNTETPTSALLLTAGVKF